MKDEENVIFEVTPELTEICKLILSSFYTIIGDKQINREYLLKNVKLMRDNVHKANELSQEQRHRYHVLYNLLSGIDQNCFDRICVAIYANDNGATDLDIVYNIGFVILRGAYNLEEFGLVCP